MQECRRIAVDGPADRRHVAAHVRMGAELDVAEDRDDVARDGAVDEGIAEHGDDVLLDGPARARAAEDRDDLACLTLARRGTKDRHDGIGVLAGREM